MAPISRSAGSSSRLPACPTVDPRSKVILPRVSTFEALSSTKPPSPVVPPPALNTAPSATERFEPAFTEIEPAFEPWPTPATLNFAVAPMAISPPEETLILPPLRPGPPSAIRLPVTRTDLPAATETAPARRAEPARTEPSIATVLAPLIDMLPLCDTSVPLPCHPRVFTVAANWAFCSATWRAACREPATRTSVAVILMNCVALTRPLITTEPSGDSATSPVTTRATRALLTVPPEIILSMTAFVGVTTVRPPTLILPEAPTTKP